MNSGRMTLVCIGLILIALMFTAQSNAKIDPASIIGVWLLDEGDGDTVGDASQNRNHGAIEGDCKWVEGQFGMALEFNEAEDYVEIPPSLLFNPDIFTFSFWMFPYVTGGNNPAGKGTSTLVFANGNPGDGGGGNWWFELWNGGNFEFKSCQAECTAALTLVNVPKKWYFVTGVYNGTEYELYIDGEFKSKGVNKVGVPIKGIMIGNALCPAGHGCDGGYFKGIIDDVAMFSDILTEDDIAELRDKGVGKALGISLAVLPAGKLTTTWAYAKEELR